MDEINTQTTDEQAIVHEDWPEMPDQSEAGKLKEIFEALKSSRQKHEMRWYIIDNFWENNHFVKAMNQLGQLESVKFPKGIQVRPIPRAKKQINSQVNIVTSNDPRWNVYPGHEDLESDLDPADPQQQAELQKKQEIFEKSVRKISQWMGDLWYFLGVKRQTRKLVKKGYKHNKAFLEIGGDAQGNIFVDFYDAYDIYHEPGISSLKETNVLIKAVSRTKQHVQETKDETGKFLYHPELTKDLKLEDRLAVSDWKNIRLKEQNRYSAKKVEDSRIGKVFLLEVWIRDGEYWTLYTYCQDKILRKQKTEFKELPFVCYSPNDDELDATSPFEDLIPMNKAVDMMAALIEGYTRTTAVGRFLKPKTCKVQRIVNEHGTQIEYEGTQPPVDWPVPQLPPSVFGTMDMYKNFMDEVGAAIMSFGKVPQGVKAFKALESLKNSEYTSQKTPIEKLEETLEEVAMKILDIADRYIKTPVNVSHWEGQDKETFKLVSEDSTFAANLDNFENDGMAMLSSKYKVKVEIQSGIAFTEEGKQQSYMDLYKEGLIPKDEALKAYKFSNVGDLLAKRMEEDAQKVSIVQTPEWAMLPANKRLEILNMLQGQGQQPAPAETLTQTQ